jgi:hypothetical protein
MNGKNAHGQARAVEFYGDTLFFAPPSASIAFTGGLTRESIASFSRLMDAAGHEDLITSLLRYKQRQRPDDWLFYQLIRRVAQSLSPKGEDYIRYTLYKWYFLTRTGYDATLSISNDQILFYVKSDENIYNIPFRTRNGQQYICLNYHDYGSIDFDKNSFEEVVVPVRGATQAFSYKVTQLPHFKKDDYLEKEVRFVYNNNHYQFRLQLNKQVKALFQNYPVVDYAYQFNMPLSGGTYNSLIPSLKQNIKGLKIKDGVDFLMHFTRYAFLFKPDSEQFGSEKRLSAEQTLLYEYSDCEDRAALFFYLVKEIYNLPMIVLTYPDHVTIGVQFDKPYGQTVEYKGNRFSICEPTPQRKDLRIGQTLPELQDKPYEVAYVYLPQR